MSLTDDVKKYYAARASVYDETAGYHDLEAEKLRVNIKERYREIFRGCKVLEVACGTGYWTRVIGEVAENVLATDIDPSSISIAKSRCKHLSNVHFQIADAYSPDGIPAGFNAALGIWWWSHIPKEQISQFLAALHSKLSSNALVLFVDQLPYDGFARTQDAKGNTLEHRILPDGRAFWIVKNFPTKQEVIDSLSGVANDILYIANPAEVSWSVQYQKK